MRKSLVVSLLFVVCLLLGASGGVLISSNFYEYHMLEGSSVGHPAETMGDFVNRGGWEPVPGSFNTVGGSIFYRRPRLRLFQ